MVILLYESFSNYENINQKIISSMLLSAGFDIFSLKYKMKHKLMIEIYIIQETKYIM